MHLAAKSKSNILVVSITADKHITKGHHRPHVPQYIRALNLAAFEMVDYVIIDQNLTPIQNIKLLKPNLNSLTVSEGAKTLTLAPNTCTD